MPSLDLQHAGKPGTTLQTDPWLELFTLAGLKDWGSHSRLPIRPGRLAEMAKRRLLKDDGRHQKGLLRRRLARGLVDKVEVGKDRRIEAILQLGP